jgi:DNA-binding winged helix-turn-helix (wHTH) protein
MPPQSQLPRVLRFGTFEVDVPAGELRKNGFKLKLQEQPFQVLCMLVEHPGEVVTREELRNRLWPADTFVDFDHGLNAAIKRLRDALGESAETPIFVQTLARRGYRFIGSVEIPGVASLGPAPWFGNGCSRRGTPSYSVSRHVSLRCCFCTTATRSDPKQVSRL